MARMAQPTPAAKEQIMVTRNSSHGRHGGNHNQQDEVKDRNPNKAAARNTDVESLASGRNVSRGGGRKHGD